MTLLNPIPPLTSFSTPGGRVHVCPTRDGIYLSVERFGASSQTMTLTPAQALELMRLIQSEYADTESGALPGL